MARPPACLTFLRSPLSHQMAHVAVSRPAVVSGERGVILQAQAVADTNKTCLHEFESAVQDFFHSFFQGKHA